MACAALPGSGVWRGHEEDGEGDEAEDGPDHHDGDPDPLPVLLAGDHRHQLLQADEVSVTCPNWGPP